MSTNYISCADTAKLVRQSLKESFPGIKFSVRSRTYAGGASMSVEWLDGPNVAQVEAITGRFEGSYFDGMIDFKGSVFHMLNGEQVRFGADSIHTYRNYSTAAIERAIDRVYNQFLGNFIRDKITRPTVADFNSGALYHVKLSGYHDLNNGCSNLQGDIRKALSKHSDRLAVAKSKTAASVFTTHDDGYSRSCGSGFSAVVVDSFHVEGATKND